MIAKSSTHGEMTRARADGDRYRFVWSQIKRLAPQAILLRGPARLNPTQASGSGDLDILVPDGLDPVRDFLKAQGFYRVIKPQTYLERFRLQIRGVPEPYTIDLYKAERWGLGFRLASNGHAPASPRLACLLHATADGKGTDYYERTQNGPPWQHDKNGKGTFGAWGRALWRTGSPSLVTLYLLFRGVIRPELSLIMRNLGRRVVYRTWQLTRNVGLEVALLGVDGTGKSSLANALLQLPAPVKVVYMGPHDYQTRIMQGVLKHRLPLPFQQLAYRYELLVRRLYGWLLARRGWIVVYDRHPAERLDPRQKSLKNRVKDLLDRVYAWPVDLTFWLTGDYPTLYMRKREYSAADLQVIDQRFQSVLEHYRIPFEKIDVTRNDLNSVASLIGEHVLAKHQERASVEGLPRRVRATLA